MSRTVCAESVRPPRPPGRSNASWWPSREEALQEAQRVADERGRRMYVWQGEAGYIVAASYSSRHPYETVAPRATQSNPAEGAQALSETFHGRPAESLRLIEQETRFHEHLADLGALRELKLKDGTRLRFTPDTRLASNEAGTQLFIVGGDQSLDLTGFDVDATKETVVLGQLRRLVYVTDKQHLGAADRRPGPYQHTLGEESGELPWVVYDTVNQQLSLAGGRYRVEAAGIVD